MAYGDFRGWRWGKVRRCLLVIFEDFRVITDHIHGGQKAYRPGKITWYYKTLRCFCQYAILANDKNFRTHVAND